MGSKGFLVSSSARCQDVLEFPSSHPSFEERALPFRLMPGVFAGELYPAREEAGGVLLPSSGGGWESEGAAAERVRPDCVTVLSVGGVLGSSVFGSSVPLGWNTGTARRASAELLAESLRPGDRVMVRPWSGTRLQTGFGVRGLCFFGQTDGWEEDAVLRLVPDSSGGEWRALSNWAVVQLDRAFGALGVVSSRTILDHKGTVLDAGPLATVRPGDRVVCADDQGQQSDDDAKWLTTKWGEWGDDVWLVREVDCEGVRRVLALL